MMLRGRVRFTKWDSSLRNSLAPPHPYQPGSTAKPLRQLDSPSQPFPTYSPHSRQIASRISVRMNRKPSSSTSSSSLYLLRTPSPNRRLLPLFSFIPGCAHTTKPRKRYDRRFSSRYLLSITDCKIPTVLPCQFSFPRYPFYYRRKSNDEGLIANTLILNLHRHYTRDCTKRRAGRRHETRQPRPPLHRDIQAPHRGQREDPLPKIERSGIGVSGIAGSRPGRDDPGMRAASRGRLV
jgi:hypothetical protein